MEKINQPSPLFWMNKKVFLTGHTGFKGSWLSIVLHRLGAKVTGYALPAPTVPSLYELGKVEALLERSTIGDITHLEELKQAMKYAGPDIIIHMAAQPLVRQSYDEPVQTYYSNVIGTLNVLEAARNCPSVRAILNVTTDKCYENQEWLWGYREDDPLGGHDPYSSSKACAEIVTSSYRRSFFQPMGVHVATARAGNVIGGGDWAEDRLIPDIVRALADGEQIQVRNPNATRPWQHVLEPLFGYLLLCQHLFTEGEAFAQSWNFGPPDSEARSVQWIVERALEKWPFPHGGFQIKSDWSKHEASTLRLDCSKARYELNWSPRWSLDKALDATIQFVSGVMQGSDAREICLSQIADYEAS